MVQPRWKLNTDEKSKAEKAIKEHNETIGSTGIANLYISFTGIDFTELHPYHCKPQDSSGKMFVSCF